MQYDVCEKCGRENWIEEHHVLPKSVFGGIGDTVKLCPNCYTDYHQKLGTKNLKNPDMVFHLLFYNKWKYGLLILFILLVFLRFL